MSLRDGVLILSDKVSGLGDIFWKLHWETSLGPCHNHMMKCSKAFL